ncbi:MAG TPA: ABC transporter permease [Candidatus Ventrousia excrementavium]|uniref:ABC transporter permease n=1 Tax=Candidatus Ventrousia excrementavium TaxID=2840961 RepID=A0A9D1LMD9_9CLOT|nr:ABC transporter permease [Candidatus Ventrousia excrementavium]
MKQTPAGKPLPPMADMWYRLRRNRAAMFGLGMIVIFILAALAGIVFIDDAAVFETNPDARLQSPSSEHIFGTDDMGRDLFLRVIYGARYSLTFGIVCTLFSLIFGAVLGASAAFFGGRVDSAITFVLDAVICIPNTLLSLSLVAVLGLGFCNLMIAITVSSIPSFARIIRSIVLSVVGQEYIEAARAIGVSSARTIFVHVLPNAIGLIIVNAAMNVSGLIMSAAGLSFIGMGIQPPAPEWGAMLSDSLKYMRTYPHIVIFPGLAIVLTALSFNLLGDGLSEALDPRMKE